jgi:subtilisin family serine protease
MKKILLLFAALTFCFYCYSQETTKVETELQAEMSKRSNEELIRINIIMQDQYDQLALRTKADLYRTKESKRSFVVNELIHFSNETQREVKSYLNFYAQDNQVSDITSFWIYNGISCQATKEVIEILASLEDVLIIGLDQEHNWLFEDENPTLAEPTREITYNVLKVNANLVWALGYTGEGIIVAIVDTGVNYNHYDLRDHMWEHPDYPNHGWNFVNNGNNPMDDHNHGTHCAGTVAGDGTAGSQTGMAPDALIMAVKVWNNVGSGSTAQMCAGIQFAVDKGAHVVSMSGGVYGGGSSSERIQFRNTMINVLEAGVVASIAAGNEGPGGNYVAPPNSVRVPGNCPPPWLHPDQTTTGGQTAVVCVGATNSNDALAGFSSLGPVTWQSISGFDDYPYSPGMGLIRPDVCAPGVTIKSCSRTNIQGYMNMDGTSMATPCVAGVMALMLSKNSNLTPAEICEILETTAVRLPNASSPKGNSFGSGRIDAFEAVSAIETCDKVSDLICTLEYDKVVTLTWSKPSNEISLMGYKIYVNNLIIEELITVESYIFQATNEGEHTFCISAVHEEDGETCVSPKTCQKVNVKSICDTVTDLTYEFEDNKVTLSWLAPELISEILHYNIYRDEIYLASVSTESFSENGVYGHHNYSVTTAYKNDCISDKTTIAVYVLAPPENLTAMPHQVAIELSWEYDDDVTKFNVYRDDAIIGSDINSKQYSDTEIEEYVEYCYFVKATEEGLESEASNVECITFIGIAEFSGNVKIYPNPANTLINIEGLSIEKITIFNPTGQIVKIVTPIDSHTAIDVSNFIPGNYVFNITFSHGATENIKIMMR